MGGNDTGKYTPAALDFMSNYTVFGLDGDHYTACTRVDKYPNGAPSCDVEGSMFEAYAHLRAKNPAQKFLYYQNSMFDFSHYNLHRQMEVWEAAGKPAYLRDQNGEVVLLTNDCDEHINVTTFDLTKPYVFFVRLLDPPYR